VPTSSWKGSPIGVSQITSATGAQLAGNIWLNQCRARFPLGRLGSRSLEFLATAIVLFQAPLAPILSAVLCVLRPSPSFCMIYPKALRTARGSALAALEGRVEAAVPMTGPIGNFAQTFITPPVVHCCGLSARLRLKTKAGDDFLQRIATFIPENFLVKLWR
jgi:hypothetical protein